MKLLCATLAALFLSGLLHAAESEGLAPLGLDGVAAARNAAIQDALENASLGAGADIKASTQSNGGKSADALRVRGQAIGGYAVLREWQANGFYHVLLDVQPATAVKEASKSTRACSGTDYLRKALVARIPVLNPAQTVDLSRLTDEMQSELARRLDGSGRFLTQRSANEAAISLQPTQAEPLQNPDWIRELARRYGVQFVIGGSLRDAAFEGEHYAVSHGQDVRPGERKSILNLTLLDFTQLGIKATPKARYFEMDIFVFDGVSGAQIYRHRLSGRAEGNVVFDPASSFATERFFASDYGRLVQTKLNEAVQLISDSVQCIPFSARITRVEPGRVYLDAGGSSRLAPGDRLQVYRLKPGARAINSVNFTSPAQLGWPEEIAGSLTVRDVQPLFSSGQPEGLLRAEVGDYVRFIGQEGRK